MSSDNDAINAAMSQLHEKIRERVRAEQQRDQLTDLPNQAALGLAVQEAIQSGASFWVAFVEVDKFKTINDRFTTDVADVLLQKIAVALRATCNGLAGSVAFRAHGDEFYLLGTSTADLRHVLAQLNLLRQNVSHIRVPVETQSMQCTVSTGWLVNTDVKTLSARNVMVALEHAVAEAKRRGRDCVVKYAPRLVRRDTISLRADCGSCHCKFSLDLERAKNKTGHLACPNCKAKVVRPDAGAPVGVAPAPVLIGPTASARRPVRQPGAKRAKRTAGKNTRRAPRP